MFLRWVALFDYRVNGCVCEGEFMGGIWLFIR